MEDNIKQSGIEVQKLEVSMFGTNCYLVRDGGTGEGFIIDPGAEAKTILKAAGRMDLECLGILCTHGHMDHVGAVGKVQEQLEVPVFISEKDDAIFAGGGGGLAVRLGRLAVSKPGQVNFLSGGETLRFGGEQFKVVGTPGHTPGSLSFICPAGIFSGDLIFQGSVGRTDLKGGSMEQLLRSVKTEVFTLGPDTRIFPGHGPTTTVAREMSTNPFLIGI